MSVKGTRLLGLRVSANHFYLFDMQLEKRLKPACIDDAGDSEQSWSVCEVPAVFVVSEGDASRTAIKRLVKNEPCGKCSVYDLARSDHDKG
jgi:hypothetical protein